MASQRKETRARARLAMGLLAIALAGCKTVSDGPPLANTNDTEMSAASGEDLQYLPSNEPLKAGLEHFKRQDYGLAERYFRDAVEKNPRNAPAWIGIAATYDRLARFDLADRAYGIAASLVGETTEILNNEGYSYMLRGNLGAARTKLLKALKQEPKNQTVMNNIKLLKSSYKISQQ